MSLQIKNKILGEGIPKVCVPITGVTKEDIQSQAREAAEYLPDMMEWRADFYEDIMVPGRMVSVLDCLEEILGDTPLIYTFRTAAEGGEREIANEEYQELCLAAAEHSGTDLIDVEVYKEGMDAEQLIEEIHQRGGLALASNHHFHETPYLMEMMNILREMEEMGADVLKLAVMPKSPQDVLNLLQATYRISTVTPRPVITMSMGRLGAVSRLCGSTFGSAVTFASIGEKSAPGQIPFVDICKILELLS